MKLVPFAPGMSSQEPAKTCHWSRRAARRTDAQRVLAADALVDYAGAAVMSTLGCNNTSAALDVASSQPALLDETNIR